MLRAATTKDIPLIQAVLNAPENLTKLEGYSDDSVYAAIKGSETAVFVWEDNGKWHGFCWLRQTSDGTKVEEFGVNRPGCGVGSRFFAAVLNRIAQEGFPAPLWLAVAADNVDAIRFYERFGFVRTELRRAVWERRMGPVADALIMTLVADAAISDPFRDQDVT